MLFKVIVFLLHACYWHQHPSNLVDIPPPLAPLFSQLTYKGAPVLCLPGEGSGTAVPPQDQPKKNRVILCQCTWWYQLPCSSSQHNILCASLLSHCKGRGGRHRCIHFICFILLLFFLSYSCTYFSFTPLTRRKRGDEDTSMGEGGRLAVADKATCPQINDES